MSVNSSIYFIKVFIWSILKTLQQIHFYKPVHQTVNTKKYLYKVLYISKKLKKVTLRQTENGLNCYKDLYNQKLKMLASDPFSFIN